MLAKGLLCICMLLSAATGWAAGNDFDDDEKPKIFGAHYGYTFEVAEERNKRDIEMEMLPKPKEPTKKVLPVIVNEKLSREFQQQYEYRFGPTAAQQVINSPGRSDEYTYYNSQNVGIVEYTKYQRQFGEYMGRRLVEYHFDDWAKNDPTIRPVYQLKDRVSNLDVQVKKGYKIKWKYNFAGPNMEATIENPYDVELKVHMDMSGIISKPSEIIYSAGYNLNPRNKIAFLYKQVDGLYQAVFTHKVNRHISTSVTGALDTLPAGPTIQQNLILFGFSWTE